MTSRELTGTRSLALITLLREIVKKLVSNMKLKNGNGKGKSCQLGAILCLKTISSIISSTEKMEKFATRYTAKMSMSSKRSTERGKHIILTLSRVIVRIMDSLMKTEEDGNSEDKTCQFGLNLTNKKLLLSK
jgi:hypothetical protein